MGTWQFVVRVGHHLCCHAIVDVVGMYNILHAICVVSCVLETVCEWWYMVEITSLCTVVLNAIPVWLIFCILIHFMLMFWFYYGENCIPTILTVFKKGTMILQFWHTILSWQRKYWEIFAPFAYVQGFSSVPSQLQGISIYCWEL